ncbi:ParB/RepB/Spo0J family partition protein [Paracoccus sp. IB05]|uniref:ParB/RepB/Spo0J family partition protein n=1 Tax=Paracoccus sp. IB05 TaxID=2779367 RepID=UPI0018E7B5E2|nr:ParB/RepB/Spo0J family partition protein [Paracoccus sp. IB05]MBJ2151577.1 ParB N-terminal domain-containing protein [Paracoccus sp. IB05]
MVSEVKTLSEVRTIPISAISVKNPRERSEKTFRALVDSIGKVGLKKPITVARIDGEAGVSYRLVCGQGRMEAYVALGETRIPTIVMDADEAERLLRSVIENIARRQQRPPELLQDIAILRDRGYSDHQIADKTGLSLAYVHEIGALIANGEERLLIAVETGQMPLARMASRMTVHAGEEDPLQRAGRGLRHAGHLARSTGSGRIRAATGPFCNRRHGGGGDFGERDTDHIRTLDQYTAGQMPGPECAIAVP